MPNINDLAVTQAVGWTGVPKMVSPKTSAAPPTTTEFPSDTYGFHYDSISGIVSFVLNRSGTLYVVELSPIS